MSASLAPLFDALLFAAQRHAGQLRKGDEAYPYINHPIAVTELLVRCGVDDLDTLRAALLHDTVEDTSTTPEELAARFGDAVRDLVLEMTDDQDLAKAERKRLQIEHAPRLTPHAKRIKIADKTCNVLDIALGPPSDWSHDRRVDYVDWAEAVVMRCVGVGPPALERAWRDALERARRTLPRHPPPESGGAGA